MADRTYTLVTKGKRIPVTREVYKAYYQEAERFRYIQGRSKSKEISLNCLEDGGAHIQYRLIPHTLEEMYIEQEMLEVLHRAVARLNSDEQHLLYELFYKQKSEREIAQSLGISQKGVNKRKKKVLAKLKIALEP